MTSVILFILGTIIGSFLNVVALRWDTGRTLAGRSACPKCNKKLSWYELVPIISFLIQCGKCRNCGSTISIQYPLIEFLTGLIFVTVPYWMLPVFSIYIVILIYDFRYKIIPDPLVFTSIFVSLITPLFFTRFSLLDWFAGPIIFAFFASIWLLSRGRAMGFGDAKLGLSIGLLLGAAQGFSSIVLAFWIGAVVSVSYLLLHKSGFIKGVKGLTMKSEVPFAPFIILGAWISAAFGLNIFNVAIF